jgi:hypothetical protein
LNTCSSVGRNLFSEEFSLQNTKAGQKSMH